MLVNKDSFTWREYRTRTVMYGLIPIFRNSLSTLTPTYFHHCSMYGFTSEDAHTQARLGNTKYREIMHYSGELVIDTDNADTAYNVEQKLINLDCTFELWQLNNYKFYIKRSDLDIPSTKMCFQDRQFVKLNFSECNVNGGLDLGIYASPFHLCRAKGSFHEITGRKSTLLYTYDGLTEISTNHIELQVFEKPYGNSTFDPNIADWQKLVFIVNAILDKNYSNKHNCFFSLGVDLRTILTYSSSLELAQILATSMNYDTEKAERALLQGFEAC